MGGLQLQDQVALVTGAASGIGAATVARLLEEGARVVGVDLPGQALPQSHERLVAREADVSQQDQVDRLVAGVVEDGGKLDILVNCAGITRDGVLWKLSDEDWCRVLDVNLTGSFRLLRTVAPVMRERGGGSIVLLASVNGLRGKFGQANYSASKAGVIALAKTAALELAAFNIRVNAVAPGMVETPMTRDLPESVLEEARRQTPLGRLGEPAEVADAIAFLCSPLSRYVSGDVLRVDGGMLSG